MTRAAVTFVGVMISLFAGPVVRAAAPICDEGMARQYCDSATLTRIEGVWEFPGDRTRVLIKRRVPDRDCDIIVVDTPDCRLTPGDVIGKVSPSAQPGTYELSICRQKAKGGILSDPGHCMAKLTDNESSLTFKPRKFNIQLGNRYFLPKFWRLFRFKFSDPESEIPQGMVRVYPKPYGSKSMEPTYL